MVYRLGPEALESSVKHLCRYGDTDVSPTYLSAPFLPMSKKLQLAFQASFLNEA
jgi:hypothetical protein